MATDFGSPDIPNRAATWCPSTNLQTRQRALFQSGKQENSESHVLHLGSILARDLPETTQPLRAQSSHSSACELLSLADYMESAADSTRFDTPPCGSSAFESSFILGQAAPKKPKIAHESDHGSPRVLNI